jgi:hypothetical protein
MLPLIPKQMLNTSEVDFFYTWTTTDVNNTKKIFKHFKILEILFKPTDQHVTSSIDSSDLVDNVLIIITLFINNYSYK